MLYTKTKSALASLLKQFGESRSMVVAPTSAADLDRAQRIGTMGKLVGENVGERLSQQDLSAEGSKAAITQALQCRSCGLALDDDARFCGECGTPVTVAQVSPVKHSDKLS